MNEELNKVLRLPDIAKRLDAQGIDVVGGPARRPPPPTVLAEEASPSCYSSGVICRATRKRATML